MDFTLKQIYSQAYDKKTAYITIFLNTDHTVVGHTEVTLYEFHNYIKIFTHEDLFLHVAVGHTVFIYFKFIYFSAFIIRQIYHKNHDGTM